MSYLGTSSGISCLTLNKQGHPTNYLHSTNYLLRLVVFTWSDFKQSQFVIGRLACSVSPPSDAKGILAIENEHKNISTWYKFLNSGLNHTNFQIVMTRLLCCESERKQLCSWETWLGIFALYKSSRVFRCLSLLQCWFVGNCTEKINCWQSPTKGMGKGIRFLLLWPHLVVRQRLSKLSGIDNTCREAIQIHDLCEKSSFYSAGCVILLKNRFHAGNLED